MKIDLNGPLGKWLSFGDEWFKYEETTNLCKVFWTAVAKAPFKFAAITLVGFAASFGFVVWPAIVALVWLQTGVCVEPAAFTLLGISAVLAAFIAVIANAGKLPGAATIAVAYDGWKNDYCPTITVVKD